MSISCPIPKSQSQLNQHPIPHSFDDFENKKLENKTYFTLQVSHLILSNFDPRLSSIPARAQYFDEGNKTYKTSEAVNFELKFYSNYDLNL